MQSALAIMADQEDFERLQESLSRDRVHTCSADGVRHGIAMLKANKFTFLVLDVDLNGTDILMDLALSGTFAAVPFIIVVGTFPESESRVEVLNQGADICMTKPIQFDELAAQIRSVLRRGGRLDALMKKTIAPCITQGDLTINPPQRSVTWCGQSIQLTPKEYDVLYLLARYPGVVFSKAEIYEYVWDYDAIGATEVVVDHISSLRQKMKSQGHEFTYIQTVFGVGYRFVVEEWKKETNDSRKKR